MSFYGEDDPTADAYVRAAQEGTTLVDDTYDDGTMVDYDDEDEAPGVEAAAGPVQFKIGGGKNSKLAKARKRTDPTWRGKPVERGWEGWIVMFLIGAMIVTRVVEFGFACGFLYIGANITAWYFWISYWVIIGLGTFAVLVAMAKSAVLGEVRDRLPELITLWLFIFLHVLLFTLETAWSAQFFEDNPVYKNHPGNNKVPSPGDAEFQTFQRLMSVFVFNTYFYAAAGFAAWLYIWDINVESPFYNNEDYTIRTYQVEEMRDSARAARWSFYAFAAGCLSVFALYTFWMFIATTGVGPGITLRTFSWIFLAGVICWVVWFIMTLYLNSRRKNALDNVTAKDPGQADPVFEQQLNLVKERYTHHFKQMWTFHFILGLFVISQSVLYIAMITDNDVMGNTNLAFDKSRTSNPNPALHTVQKSTYYIFQANAVICAAVFCICVYVAGSLVASWGLFSPNRILIKANLIDFVDPETQARYRQEAGNGTRSEKWFVWAYYAYVFTGIGLAVATLAGWYYLNKHFLTWTAVTFAVSCVMLATILMMNLTFERRYKEANQTVGPTVKLVRWRTFFTLAAIVFLRYWWFWDFWDHQVEPMNSERIPTNIIKGTPPNRPALTEVAVLWFNGWTLWVVLSVVEAVALSDFVNSIGKTEVYIPAFTAADASNIKVSDTKAMLFEAAGGSQYGYPSKKFTPALVRRPQ